VRSLQITFKSEGGKDPPHRFRHLGKKIAEQPETHVGIVEIGLLMDGLLEKQVSLASIPGGLQNRTACLIRQAAVPIDASKVEFRRCIVIVIVEKTITDINHLFGLVKKRLQFFLVTVEAIEVEMDNALKERATWITGGHPGNRVERRLRAVHLKAVELMEPPHCECVHRSPIGDRSTVHDTEKSRDNEKEESYHTLLQHQLQFLRVRSPGSNVPGKLFIEKPLSYLSTIILLV
jgi:hypothetical protein